MSKGINPLVELRTCGLVTIQDQSYVQIRLGINPQSNSVSPLQRTEFRLVLFSYEQED